MAHPPTTAKNGSVSTAPPEARRQREPEHLTVAERRDGGHAARKAAPRTAHGQWSAPTSGRDALAILAEQDKGRLPDLVPVRYSRMVASPFAFFRGAAAVMAHDLAGTTTSGVRVQLCGDAHLSNFGVYGSPERALLFDINDFDETLPGPWEWDVKRLAASVEIAGRVNGYRSAQRRAAVSAVTTTYAEAMRAYAAMDELDLWYATIDAEEVASSVKDQTARRRALQLARQARSNVSLKSAAKLTQVVDGRRQFLSQPPLLVRLPVQNDEEQALVRRVFQGYRRSLDDQQRHLLDRFSFVDVARKVVGVGSVGTRCYVVLLQGHEPSDVLLLQIKEAGPSSLASALPRSQYHNEGQRVVAGQRLLQSASDILLGWFRTDAARDFYVRQLRDMKGSVPIEALRPTGMRLYAGLCARALANAHARSGDRVAIAAYLGKGESFGRGIAGFASAYADQNERDHGALVDAIAAARIDASESPLQPVAMSPSSA